MIRSVEKTDLDEIKRIWGLYFRDDFELPDFFDYLCAFVVEDDKGVLTIGGVRDVAECTIITNKERDVIDRIKALYHIFEASVYVARQSGYDQLYAFSNDVRWSNRLRRNGFRPHHAKALVLDI